jgi:hypothetical protein
MNGSVTIITPVYNAMPYLPNYLDYRSIKEKEEDITLLLDKYGRYIAP